MFSHNLSFQLVSKQVHILRFHYLCVILDPPLAMEIAMEKANMNCSSCVCDNDCISIFRGCPRNKLIELLKSKKDARIFIHMLKCLEHRNRMLHNSLCEFNSLIKKYKRRNRHLCDKLDNLCWVRIAWPRLINSITQVDIRFNYMQIVKALTNHQLN